MVERNSKANVRRCSILITFPGVVTQAASKPTKCLGSEATLLRRGRNDINLGIYLLTWDEKEKEGGNERRGELGREEEGGEREGEGGRRRKRKRRRRAQDRREDSCGWLWLFLSLSPGSIHNIFSF